MIQPKVMPAKPAATDLAIPAPMFGALAMERAFRAYQQKKLDEAASA